MITIKDVAREAGVSISSVSKVFNGYTDIGEKTKKKVLDAAKKLNYSPNIIAQTLSKKTTNTIALILSNFNEANGEDGVIFRVMNGVFNAVNDAGYDFTIFTATQSQQEDKSYYQMCKERKVAGVIIMGLKTTDRYFDEIINSEVPTVVIDANVVGKHTSSISINNEVAAKEAVNFLVKKGHTEIGFINGHKEAYVAREREKGYIKGLNENGLKYDEKRVLECDFSEIKAYMKAEEYISKNKDITAIFFASDMMAIGFMKRCKEIGVRVPQDISIMGFDDINLCNYVMPPLSTVSQDFVEMGREAVKLLINNINSELFGKHFHLIQNIVDRESVRKYNLN